MFSIVASLPSPSSGTLTLGPFRLHVYGLMIALGVVAATRLASKRLESTGAGTVNDMSSIAGWGVIGGIIGARLYHVVTDWSSFSDNLGRIPLIWKGGLGIPGGLLGGISAGLWAAHRKGIPVAVVATVTAPAIALGQSIGRWGNWWNQELFGGPTTSPWALRISDHMIPPGYPPGTTFHPTFLYESLWNLALCGVLLWIDRRGQLKPGRLMAVYLVGYFSGRFWIEGIRIDRAHVIAGLRLNQWVALAVVVCAGSFLLLDRFRSRTESEPITAIVESSAAESIPSG